MQSFYRWETWKSDDLSSFFEIAHIENGFPGQEYVASKLMLRLQDERILGWKRSAMGVRVNQSALWSEKAFRRRWRYTKSGRTRECKTEAEKKKIVLSGKCKHFKLVRTQSLKESGRTQMCAVHRRLTKSCG